MAITPQRLSADRLATIEAAVNTPAGPSAEDLRELLAETKRARTAEDTQYTEADYWRESYRLVKNLTNDEVGAIIAVRDASRSHPGPCRFPHEACVCGD